MDKKGKNCIFYLPTTINHRITVYASMHKISKSKLVVTAIEQFLASEDIEDSFK